jgi:hypothetical protein
MNIHDFIEEFRSVIELVEVSVLTDGTKVRD